MMAIRNWRHTEIKASELRSETFDSIVEIVLALEDERDALKETVSELTSELADAQAAA